MTWPTRITRGKRDILLSFAKLRDDMGSERNGDVLQLGVKLEGVLTALAMRAAELDAAEGRGQMTHVVTVDPGHAGFEREGHAVRPRYVAHPDVGCKAVLHVIGLGQRVGFVLERNGCQNGTKNLLLRNAHVIFAGQQGGGDVVSFRTYALAADQKPRAFFLADIDISQHAVAMFGMDEGTDFGIRIERAADFDPRGAARQRPSEFVEDRFFNQRARIRRAALAIETVDLEDRGIESAVKIRVRENDGGRFAA